MNKKEKTILVFCAATCIFAWVVMLGAWTNTYDTATPAGTDDPIEADDRMREIKAAIQERLAVEHKFALVGTEVSAADTGKHSDITSDSIVNAGDVATATLTATGDASVGGDAAIAGGATVGGDAGVTGTLGVTGIATVAKGSLLASTDAPTTDAMIANKKYVDDQVATKENTLITQATASIIGPLTNKDTVADTLVKDVVYLAQCSGFVFSYNITTNSKGRMYMSATPGANPPTLQVQYGGDSYGGGSMCAPIAAGDYVRITVGAGTEQIFFQPIGTGGLVK